MYELTTQEDTGRMGSSHKQRVQEDLVRTTQHVLDRILRRFYFRALAAVPDQAVKGGGGGGVGVTFRRNSGNNTF